MGCSTSRFLKQTQAQLTFFAGIRILNRIEPSRCLAVDIAAV